MILATVGYLLLLIALRQLSVGFLADPQRALQVTFLLLALFAVGAIALFYALSRDDQAVSTRVLVRVAEFQGPDPAQYPVADYDAAIQINAQSSEAYVNRGLVRLSRSQMDLAVGDLTHAIELSPQSLVPLVGRGLAFANMGQNDKALADYSQAIQLDPKDVSAFYNRANLYNVMGEREKAIQDYTSPAIGPTKRVRPVWARQCLPLPSRLSERGQGPDAPPRNQSPSRSLL